MMNRWILVRAAFALAITLLAAPSVVAGEPFAEFLKGLQDGGYGEVALEYIDKIEKRTDVPVELRQILDLERSKSFRIAAAEAYDAQQRDFRLAEAKRLADKFFAENPSHPAAGTALLGEADQSLLKGQMHLAEARVTKEPAAKEKALADAREAFKTALGQYVQAERRLKEKFDALPPPPEKPARKDTSGREELEYGWLEARFKTALCAYLTAQTYSDPKAPERTKLLQAAGQAFDVMFQEYRGKRIAYLTHMWHGKCLEELGDTELALEVYDEVLVVAPDDDADIELAPLFGQAQLFRLKLLLATDQAKDMLAEADEWLQSHRKWQSTPVYQGIALEAVKGRLASVEKARGASEKAKLQRDAVVALTAIGKVESEYRHEAMLLRRELVESMGSGGTMTFEERLALGDEAVGEKNWESAESIYREAAIQAAKTNDEKRVATAKQRLGPVLYQLTLKQYAAGDMEKVLTLASEIVRDNADQPIAETASAVAVAAALQLYTTAADEAKAEKFARLEKVANYAISHWSNTPVGDDARMALAQASLIRGDFEPALQILTQVSNQSKRYPTALQIHGQIRWKQYIDGKKAKDAAEHQDELQKLRGEAVTSLQGSVERQRASWRAGAEPMPPSLFDTQLLLAETHLEGQQPKEAAALYEPLAAELEKSPPAAVDQKVQRVMVGSVRSQLASGEPVKAGAAALKIATFSPDAAQSNSLLIDLAKLFSMEIRKAEAAAEGATPDPIAAKLREAQAPFLDQVVSRKELSVPQLIFLGDACVLLNKNDKAREVYQRLLDNVDADASAKESAGAATTGLRARLVGLLRAEGKLEEANKQVDALIKAHPTALGPLMEKGNILDALAQRDPKRNAECVAHWTDLRVKLGRSKNRPPEYYEVLYNAASALVRQARVTKDKEKALLAEQMLKSTLTLTPKLSGPDMVIKYEALLKQAAQLRGVTTPVKTTAVSR